MKKLFSLIIITALAVMTLVSCGEHIHSFNDEWTSDETHHWHDCKTKTCTEVQDKAEHTFDSFVSLDNMQHKKTCECGFEATEYHTFGEGEVTTEPTPDTDGVETFTCTGCGETKTEPIFYGHTHVYGDFVSISDTQHKKTCECGLEIVANHVWDNGEVTTPATPDTDGIKSFTCTDCGKTKTEAYMYAINPYEGVSWGSVDYVKSMTHYHLIRQELFDQAVAEGYRHFAITHYSPSKPFYPLEDYYTGVPDNVVASPNTEKAYNINGYIHYCSLGSFAEGHGNLTGAIAPWQTAFDEIFESLQYPDGGGITINHPDYPTNIPLSEYIERLDYDERVLGIEIYNDASYQGEGGAYGIYLDIWDTILSSGRKCYGFGVVDWTTEYNWGSNVLLVPTLSEENCLKAYRNGEFYVQLKDTGLRFTNLTLEDGRIYVSTNRETEIRFVSTNGEVVKTTTGTEAYYDVEDGDMYVRVEACEGGDFFNTIFSQPFMFVEDARPVRTHYHSYSDEWTSDATHHWHAPTCDEHVGCAYMKAGKAEHTDLNSDNRCDTCNKALTAAVTVSEDSERIALVTEGALSAGIGEDIFFTVAVDDGYELVVSDNARVFGKPSMVGGKKQYVVKVAKIAEDLTVTLGVRIEGLYNYSSLGTQSSATATSTLYYDPATGTFSAASTGAAGEISYTITYRNGATTTLDSLNNTYTVDKSAVIESIVASDGSSTITFGDKSYGVGDKIPARTYFYSTSTATNPRLFPASASLSFTGFAKRDLDGDLLYEFKSDFAFGEIDGAGNRFFVSLMSGNTTVAFTSIYLDSNGSDAFYGAVPGTSYSFTNGRTWKEVGTDKFNFRITVTSIDGDSENVNVTVYINGTQAGNLLTVPKFNLDKVVLNFQDDGTDRNTTVTMSDTCFFKYEYDYIANEPTTNQLPTESSLAATVTVTVYEKDGVFSTTDNGGTRYDIVYKNTPDVTVNPDGSVTFAKVATIVSITSGGRDATISYLGTVYGAAPGTVNVISSRDFLGISRGFASGGQVFSGSYGRTTPTSFNVTNENVDRNILSVVEFDMTVDSIPEDNNNDDFILSLTYTGQGGAGVTAAAFARVGSSVTLKKFDNGTHVRNGVKVADIGETFTVRIEYRQNGENYDYVIYINGTLFSTTTLPAANANRHEFAIGFRDDAPERNNVVTFANFKYLKYVFPSEE